MTIENRIHQYLQSGRSWYQRDVSDIKKITIHHSAIPLSRYSRDGDMMNAIMKTHSDHGWPGLSYHFVLSKEKIYQTNNFSDITWHDKVNKDSIGVLVNGYFHPEVNDRPAKRQLGNLKWLLTKLSTEHPEFPADFDDILGHRERSSTACPGASLYPFVVEFREKAGKVDWGDVEPENELEERLIKDFGVKTLDEMKIVWDQELKYLEEAREHNKKLSISLKNTQEEFQELKEEFFGLESKLEAKEQINLDLRFARDKDRKDLSDSLKKYGVTLSRDKEGVLMAYKRFSMDSMISLLKKLLRKE